MEVFNFESGEDDGRKEELHQIDCTSYINLHYPELNYFHVANESGTRAAIQFIIKRERMGVKKGVHDMHILTPTKIGEYPFATVELKRPAKKSRVSPEQKQFGEKVLRDGGLSVVCYGHMAFRRFLNKYY